MGRFLLASDDARTRIGIAGALERAGHHVDRVTQLRLAAQSADLSSIDAVVVGLEQLVRCERFIERVRTRSPGTPVVALLDSRAEWQIRRLQALGTTVILARPLQVEELVTQLEKLAAAPTGPASPPKVSKGPILTLSGMRTAHMPARA